MKQQNIWEYIYVGTCLRFIQDQFPGMLVIGPGKLVENLQTFLDSLDSLTLHVTKRASGKLIEILEEMSKRDPEYKLTTEDAERVRTAANDVRKTFSAETSGVFTYLVTDKRIDVYKLLSDTPALFAPGILNSCPEITRYDFAEAGKCIAFERPTTAAFHVLRGTESVVQVIYKRYIRPAQPNLTWGQMTHALAAKTKGKRPPQTILHNLEHIRINFRNPTQHPDKIYDIQEAQDLFSLCVDAINRIISDVSA